MLSTNRKVELPDVRNRKDNKCFYCKVPVGAKHDSDCPIPQKTVVVDVTIRCTIAVPEWQTPEGIDFHFNEHTATTNIYSKLPYYVERHDSIWWSSAYQLENGLAFNNLSEFEDNRIHVKYVREATPEDEAYDGIFADDPDSERYSL